MDLTTIVGSAYVSITSLPTDSLVIAYYSNKNELVWETMLSKEETKAYRTNGGIETGIFRDKLDKNAMNNFLINEINLVDRFDDDDNYWCTLGIDKNVIVGFSYPKNSQNCSRESVLKFIKDNMNNFDNSCFVQFGKHKERVDATPFLDFDYLCKHVVVKLFQVLDDSQGCLSKYEIIS